MAGLYEHTPKIVVMFFICLALFMGAFGYIATSTDTGLFTDNAYKKGLDFAKINSHGMAQVAYPFDITIVFSDSKVKISLSPHDENSDIKIAQSWIVRPVDKRFDKHLNLTNSNEDRYESEKLELSKGLWEARIKVIANNEEFYFAKKIIVD
ncbi:MAG: FixH family protein [Alphaproteobacteria bacterium]|jgi:nitrogen fixation protein FixH|nr:FixH family protein [Candidatus Jidaibacter sp.]